MLIGLAAVLLSNAYAQDGIVSMQAAKPDYYVIVPGDTLWDISTVFLDDAYKWPELWSVNEYITNPHWIYPGNKIYFNLGDSLSPPSAGVNEPEDSGYVPVRPVEETSEIACDFPPRFDGSADDVSVSAPGFIGDAEDFGIRGSVYGADVPGKLLGAQSYLYVEIDSGDPPECGDLLGVYRRQGKRIKNVDREVLGYMYRALGTVQVMRVDDDIATVQLRDSFTEIERGDLVGDAVPVAFTIDVREPEDELNATIVARLTEEQYLANMGETVFLDHGLNDGVDVGQSLYIVERRDGQDIDKKEDERLPERVVGRVVVVRADPDFATAVVVNAARDVQVGQRLTTQPNAR